MKVRTNRYVIMKLTYKHTAFACALAYVAQAAIINLTPLFYTIFQRDYAISLSGLASLVLIMFFTQMLVDVASAKLVPIFGYRKSALFSCTLETVGFVLLGVLPRIMPNAYAGLVIATVVISLGAGVTDCIVSPLIDAISVNAKASHMSLLHSCYSWGHVLVIILTTVTLRIIGQGNWFYIPIAWSLLTLVTLILFTRVPVVDTNASDEGSAPSKLILSKRFLTFFLIMLCGGAAEQIIAQWASLFAETGLGVTKVVGDLLGSCMFAFFMAIGRTGYGIVGRRVKIDRILVISLALTVVCYLGTVFGHYPIVSLIGCAVSGLGVSLLWPGTLSMTAEKIPGGTAMFGMLALGGDIGCSLGPWLTGVVSDSIESSGLGIRLADTFGVAVDEVALKGGILVGTLFPLAMLALILRVKRKKRAK